MEFGFITDLAQRARSSFQHYGPTQTVVKLYWRIVDHLFDIRYGIDTCTQVQLDQLTIDSDNKVSGFSYHPTRVIPLRKLFKALKPSIPSHSVLVDLGCGKGRVPFIAAEFDFKEVRGVEFAKELCEIAKKNCAIYKAKTGVRTDFHIVESDVTDYAINLDENVFFMFNPFDEKILNVVLHNIAVSLLTYPRKIWIIYHNPRGKQIAELQNRFVRLQELDFLGYAFVVYSNCD